MKTDISELYQNLLSGKISCEDAADIIQSNDVRRILFAYLNKDRINRLIPYTESDLQFIYDVIRVTQYIFNNSGISTGLTDSEYDTLYEILLANSGLDVTSVPVTPNNRKIVYHKYPALRGTLSKVYQLTKSEYQTNPYRIYLDDWIGSMERKVKTDSARNISLQDAEIYVFPKFDGVSVVFEYNENNELERALLRGSTDNNETHDVKRHFKNLPKRDYQEFKNQPYGVKTEVMMKDKDLKKFNEKYHTNYKNTRSVVAAILNSEEADEKIDSFLTVVPLRVGNVTGVQDLASEVFEDYPYIRCMMSDREKIREFAMKNRTVNGCLRTDGAVIYIIDPELQEVLGRDGDKNRFEVAYKFTEEIGYSEIVTVEFTVGLFGKITPVAKIKPIRLKGNMISNVSLGSIGRMKSLDLRYQDRVKILYDIIPYLVFDATCEHSDEDVIPIIDTCPVCDELLEETDGGELRCKNPKCPCIQKGKIINYLNKIDVRGVSYGGIDILYRSGIVTKIEDLYKLSSYVRKHKTEVTIQTGLSQKIIKKWAKELHDHSVLFDYEMLGALGIPHISTTTFKNVMKQMTLVQLLGLVENSDIETLKSVKSVGLETAKQIILGISENLSTIEYLMDRLTIIPFLGMTEPKFQVCFTKIRDEDLEKKIHAYGGDVVETITNKTTLLVVPRMDTESSKVTKAKQYGIRIIPIDDLESVLEEYRDS